MFEVTEQRMLARPPEQLEAGFAADVSRATQVSLQPVMPQMWRGKATSGNWNLFPTVTIRVWPVQSGSSVEVQVGADLESTGLVLFIVLIVFFWPAAAIIGYLAYDDFQKKRTFLLQSVWQTLGQ